MRRAAPELPLDWVDKFRARRMGGVAGGSSLRPMDSAADGDVYIRALAEPAVDLHGTDGSAMLDRTVLPVEAEANVTIRLAPGQDPAEIGKTFERLLRETAPEGAEVEIAMRASSPPVLAPSDTPLVSLAQDAFEHVLRRAPSARPRGRMDSARARTLERRHPAKVTRLALPDSNTHSLNERLLVDYLPLGVVTAHEHFIGFDQLG